MSKTRLIIGIGGTLRANSSTETSIRRVLAYAQDRGAETRIFCGPALDLPMYAPGKVSTEPRVLELVATFRAAHGIVIGSPGYHGGISGLVKNALDYTEELANDPLPYWTGKPIGLVATGSGWQGCNSTLHALRNVAHALRGWPTPLGIALNTKTPPFDSSGNCVNGELEQQLRLMAEQLVGFGQTSSPGRSDF
jgi:FMN reductase